MHTAAAAAAASMGKHLQKLHLFKGTAKTNTRNTLTYSIRDMSHSLMHSVAAAAERKENICKKKVSMGKKSHSLMHSVAAAARMENIFKMLFSMGNKLHKQEEASHSHMQSPEQQ